MKITKITKIVLQSEEQFYDVIDCYPYNNFAIQTSSSVIFSHNCNFTDEVNFGLTNDVEKLKKKQKQLISQIDARMKSRFLRGTYLPTLNIIASSKNSDQSFLDDYINSKKKNESTTTLIVDEPQWVVDSRKDSKEKFFVAVGNKFLANELLPKDAPQDLVDEYRAKGYTMLEVPIGYYENFQDNIDGALTDIAGIATASSLKYISGMRWNEIKIDTYQNPFIQEIIEVGTGSDDVAQYSDFFDLSRVPIELKGRPLYVHLDMSKSGDKTGISGVYVTGKKPKIEGQDASRELFFRVAFNVSVKAPKGREISFDKNRAFIRWLRDKGFAVKGVSCFKGNTLIQTPDGLVAIKDIKPGDKVFAFDDENHCVVEELVYDQVNKGPRTDFIKVWFTDSDYIECTPEHLIKTQRGYVKACEITQDDSIEVDLKLFYKQKLLHTNYFIDNNYLEEYVQLITQALEDSQSTNNYQERHHIIPKCIYKLKGEEVDNSSLNLATLPYIQHIRAHYLLMKCSVSQASYKMASAILKMLGNSNFLNEEEFQLFLQNTTLQEQLLEVKNCHRESVSILMKGNQNVKGRHHTEEERRRISESNRKPHNIHPSSEFKPGNVPWNTNHSWSEFYTQDEIKQKFSRNEEYVWITNNVDIEKLALKNTILPEGYCYGRLSLCEETKQQISNTLKQKGIKPPAQFGFTYYTNGVTTIRIFAGDKIPEGFYKGRTINTSKAHSKNFLNSQKFKSIDKQEYLDYFMTHTAQETAQHFKISAANHASLCRFYGIRKRKLNVN